jgi:prevent-host-death family protein
MKQLAIESLADGLDELLEAAQHERVLVSRYGRPVAVIVGLDKCDAEDWSYMLDPEFWKMIEERRRETEYVTLDEVRAKLDADEDRERHEQHEEE